MVIDSQTYKYEACSITGDECCSSDCRTCDVAIEENKDRKKEHQKEELERYTKFERESVIEGVKVLVDPSNVIAKTDKSSVQLLQEKGIISKNTTPYHPDNLKQYTNQLKKLRQYQNLGIPDEIWARKNYPAAFRWETVYFLIAPRIESE